MNTVLALLPSVMQSVLALLDYIRKVRAAAQQSAEWTPELEKAYADLLDVAATEPQWQPDPPQP